jgi:hypothetical protein
MSYAASTYATKITIDHTQVGATQTDFVHIIDGSVLPAAMLDSTSGTSAKDGGGDLLVYEQDPTGGVEPATRYSLHVRDFTVAAGPGGTAQLAVGVPAVSSLVDQDYWIAWGDAAASQPAASAPFGSESVYSSDYRAVWTFEQNPAGGAPQLTDATGNSADATSGGSMTAGDLVPGKIGQAWDFDGTDDFASVTNAAVNTGQGNPLTVACWINTSAAGNHHVLKNHIQDTHGWQMQQNVGDISFRVRNGVSSVTSLLAAGANDGLDHMLVGVIDSSSNVCVYVDASPGPTAAADASYPATSTLQYIARRNTGLYFDGLIDETWIIADGWDQAAATTHYNSQNAPGTFAGNNGVHAIGAAVAAQFPYRHMFQ